ncbi:MAG TPA: MATE family efflux transporter [Thermoanaerobaculia bacterium]|nr:MATE family efflux transporter [Thermoanaerobaculia bacterium]
MIAPDLSLPLPAPSTLRAELAAAARLAAPVAFVQLGSMLMGVVDTIMLGHLSAEALAAGALGHIATIVFLMTGVGVLSALDPLVAQAYGAGDSRAISAHLQRGIVLALALAIPLAFVFWDIRELLRLLGQPAAILDDSAAYVRAILWGTPAFFLFFAFRQPLQAMHVVRPAAVAIVIGNLINVASNWVLIFGNLGAPALGTAGSAYATSLSRWMMLGYLVFASRRSLAPYWRGFTAEAVSLRRHLRLLRIGLPIGALNAIELGLFVGVALLMGRMGVHALGGHQIAINLVGLSFMVPLGVSGAASARVGNAIGREDMPGARRSAAACLLLGAGVMILFALLFGFFPEPLARLYTSDAAVIAMAASLLPIAAVFQVLDGVQVVAAGVMRGAADTAFPALIAILGFWGIGFPSSWYLGFRAGLGPVGLWWGFTAGLAAVALLYSLRIATRFRGQIARESG